MKYKLRPLNDVSEYIARGVTPAYCEEGRGIPVINQKCVRNNIVSLREARRTDPARKRVAPQKQLEPFDVLVNSTGVGTLGRTAQVRNVSGIMTVDSHITIVRPAQGLNPLFFGYAMQWRQPQIEALAEGSTGQTELSRNRLGTEIYLPVPPMATQQAIGEILYPLDEQLATLRASIIVLEEQAEAIYQHWFAQQLPTGAGEALPPGWRVDMVGNLPIRIADFVANGSFASLKENVTHYDTPNHAIFVRNVDLKSQDFCKFVDRHSYDYLAKTKLIGGELIISNVGDVGSVYLCPRLPKRMTLGNNMILVDTFHDAVSLNYYLYLYFKGGRGKKLLETITGGSVQMKFNKTDFRALRIPVPSNEALESFNSIVSEFFELQNTCRSQMHTLASIRDSLLPRLMTGEIEV